MKSDTQSYDHLLLSLHGNSQGYQLPISRLTSMLLFITSPNQPHFPTTSPSCTRCTSNGWMYSVMPSKGVGLFATDHSATLEWKLTSSTWSSFLNTVFKLQYLLIYSNGIASVLVSRIRCHRIMKLLGLGWPSFHVQTITYLMNRT